MKKSEINRLEKLLQIENPKLFWQTPLWKLLKTHGKGILTEDLVQKSKLIGESTYRMLKRERFLEGMRRQ